MRPGGTRAWAYRLRQLTMLQVRAAWGILMLSGFVTVWVLTAQWPEPSMASLSGSAAYLIAGHLVLMRRAFRHRDSRLAMERFASIKLSGLPVPPKDTWFGRQYGYAVLDMFHNVLCELLLCHGYLAGMPAGWFALVAHFGLRIVEDAIWASPDAARDEETENSVALTVEMAHALVSAAFGLYVWLRL